MMDDGGRGLTGDWREHATDDREEDGEETNVCQQGVECCIKDTIHFV